MNDDWRLQLQAADEGEALLLVERLGGPGPGHTLGTAFDDKVIVSREGAQVFLYAATRSRSRLPASWRPSWRARTNGR